MRINQQLRFGLRLLWQEWKGGELTILLLALLVAIASHTSIGHVTSRISRAMEINANDVIGGDMVLSSSRKIDQEVKVKAVKLGIEVAEVQRFLTVINAGEEILLVSVKSVGDNYPLKGSLKVTNALFAEETSLKHGPTSGNVWVEARVLHALDISLGDSIAIGEASFIVDKILTYEPDRGNSFYSFNPSVMIAQEDLEKTAVVQPGSRVGYRNMFAGNPAAITAMGQWLDQNMDPGQHIHTLEDDRPAVSNALERAQRYMGLASLIALLLAAIAIANSGRYYSERHYDTSALLRCLGCSQTDILRIYLIQLCLLAVVGGILGNIIGWAAQAGLLAAVSNLLPKNIPAPGWSPVISGMVLSFIVLLGFTLPSILRLKSVSPQRVLRQDLTPLPISSKLVYLSTLGLVMLMMWVYTNDLMLTLSIIAGSMIVILVAGLAIYALFLLIAKFLNRAPINVRAGIRNFLRRRREAIAQTVAFGLTIMAMLVVVFLRTELLSNWKNTLPQDAPNHFVINIQSTETGKFDRFLKQNDIDTDNIYPVVRGRLTRINNKPVITHVSKDERHNESLNRELNLTWSSDIPMDNKIVEGHWWDHNSLGNNLVSVESELATKLSIKVGDKLTFFTGDQDWESTVASLRSVKWENFNPNFYMIFNQGALDHLPTTWLSSFYLEPDRKKLLVGMLEQFPSITLLEVDAILRQVQSIISQVTMTIESILFFVLAAGFVVTLSAIQSTMNDRLREGALIRTLGANRRLLRINQWSEFASMGWLSGLIGVTGAEITNAVLYHKIFELNYSPTWWAWILIPVLSALFIGLAGNYSSRKVLNEPPMNSLRELRP